MTVLELINTAPSPIKLRGEDFMLLDRSGAFDPYAKTELIDGAVVVVNADVSQHYIAKNRLYRRIADACEGLGRGIEAWSEGSIDIPPHNVPHPNIFITDALPSPGLTRLDTVLLVVEIAHTSLRQDLGAKLALYAGAGIPEYWVADVSARVIHQLWAPEGQGYDGRVEVAFGETIAAATIEKLAVDTAGL